MTEAEEAPEGRTLRVGTIVLAGVALTLFFMLLRFPYERLADRIAESVEHRTGARLQLGEVSLGLVRWGPGLTADGVRVHMPSGSRVELDRVGVRPALSLSWLRGRPALATEADGAQGGAHGVITLGEGGGFRGRLEAVQLGELPAELLSGPLQIEGRVDADVDLAGGQRGSEGRVVFQAREGLLQHPGFPLPIPFDSLEGEIDLGGDRMAAIRRFDLSSPLASGRATGNVGHAAVFADAPLDLDIELVVSDAIRGSLNAQGVKVGKDGRLRMNVMGTPAEPIVR